MKSERLLSFYTYIVSDRWYLIALELKTITRIENNPQLRIYIFKIHICQSSKLISWINGVEWSILRERINHHITNHELPSSSTFIIIEREANILSRERLSRISIREAHLLVIREVGLCFTLWLVLHYSYWHPLLKLNVRGQHQYLTCHYLWVVHWENHSKLKGIHESYIHIRVDGHQASVLVNPCISIC